MKTLVTAGLLWAFAGLAHAACTQGTLTGDWALEISAINGGEITAVAGILNFDGERKVKIVQARVHTLGFRSPALTGGGTYTVKDNCMVTITINLRQTGEKFIVDGALVSPSEMKIAASQKDELLMVSAAGEAKKLTGL